MVEEDETKTETINGGKKRKQRQRLSMVEEDETKTETINSKL